MPCVGLVWFLPFLLQTGLDRFIFKHVIGLNRIDPGAALLYYVPDCTGLFRFFLCTGLYLLYYVPVCTGLYRMYRYITGPLGPGARAPWPRGPGPLAQGPGPPGPGYITNRIYEPD